MIIPKSFCEWFNLKMETYLSYKKDTLNVPDDCKKKWITHCSLISRAFFVLF